MYKLYAFAAVLVFIGSIFLYVCEFDYLSNTIELSRLLAGTYLVSVLLLLCFFRYMRLRFSPLSRHYPEVIAIVVAVFLFAPLAGSLLNRSAGITQYAVFEFEGEQAFIADRYGLLRGEKLEPDGWYLYVKEHGEPLRFTYKRQAYFPLTQTGEKIELPLRKGLFGVRVLQLK